MQRADRWRRAVRLALLGLAATAVAAAQPADGPADGATTQPADPDASLSLETFDFAWQKIADTFWDESMGGVDWHAVRDELRPLARDAAGADELRPVLRDMLSRLGQSHFGVLPGPGSAASGETPPSGPEGDGEEGDGEEAGACSPALARAVLGDGGSPLADAGPGFDFRFVDSAAVVTRVEPGSAADRLGLAAGLEVVRVGGQELASLARCLGIESAEGPVAATLRSRVVAGLLYGRAGDAVTVEFADRDGGRRPVELQRRYHPDAIEIAFGNLPPVRYRFETEVVEIRAGRVLTVRFNVWMLPVVQAFGAALYGDPPAAAAPFDGVLIDLRGNPGGVGGTSMGVAGYLVNEPTELGRMVNRGSDLRFRATPRRSSSGGLRTTPFAGPVAVLVDGGSASTSEIFAAGLQDHGRARIFGQPTMAAALPAAIEELPNGDLLMRAVADFVRPNGERVEGRPVVPDSLHPLTRESLAAGRDEPREAALAWIESELDGAARGAGGPGESEEDGEVLADGRLGEPGEEGATPTAGGPGESGEEG